MCGIAAIFNFDPSAPMVDAGELERISASMIERGPDGAGRFLSSDGRVGLTHRRLAILDPDERAAQPMRARSGDSRLVFNGEIYNHRALREQLGAPAGGWRTESDTEVLLELLEREGDAGLTRLRGMFALAYWDARRGALLLARDPYGIKPLYYAERDAEGRTGCVRAASQVRALVAGGRLRTERDPAAEVGFLLTGSVPEPFSWLEDVKPLSAGGRLWIDERGVWRPKGVHPVASRWNQSEARANVEPSTPLEEAEERVAAALEDSVALHYLESDRPVGLFLSAGIDSAALLGFASDLAPTPVRTLTLSFDEFAGTERDEAPLAAEIAAHYGAEHAEVRLSSADFAADFPRFLDSMDQPSIDGANSYFVSKAAREAGLVVALSGLGGDELLGGYPSFHSLDRWVRRARRFGAVPGSGRLARQMFTGLKSLGLWPKGASPKLAAALELGGTWPGAYLLRRGLFLPHELSAVIGRDRTAVGLERLNWFERAEELLLARGAFARTATLEACLYMQNQLLRDTDWASMAHSLEVRVPWVDSELLRVAGPYLADRRRPIDKRWLARAPRRPLLDAWIERKKSGFEVPIGKWIERSDEFGAWRDVPLLQREGCPWARRWAVTLLERAAGEPERAPALERAA